MLAEQVPFKILDNCFDLFLTFRRGYSSTIVGWCSNGKRAKMQQGVKTWWRRSTLEVITINLGDLLEVTSTSLEVTSTHTNILVSTRTLLCLQALQQPDQAAGWFHNVQRIFPY